MSSFIIFQFFFFFALVHIHNQEKYERVIYFAYFAFSFTLLSVLYLSSVFLLFLCLCTFEPIKTFLFVSLPTCHSLHIFTLQHLIDRISNFDIFLVLGRAGPDFVGLTSLSIYSITFWNLDRARRDFVGLTSF